LEIDRRVGEPGEEQVFEEKGREDEDNEEEEEEEAPTEAVSEPERERSKEGLDVEEDKEENEGSLRRRSRLFRTSLLLFSLLPLNFLFLFALPKLRNIMLSTSFRRNPLPTRFNLNDESGERKRNKLMTKTVNGNQMFQLSD
jgi:hypothetical protein